MFDQRGTVSSFHLVKHFDDCSCDVAWNNKQAGLVIKLGLRVLALGFFYSAPPLLTTEHCSFFLLFCFNLLALSLLRDASKQKQISISNRCCFTDLFTLLISLRCFWRLFTKECHIRNKATSKGLQNNRLPYHSFYCFLAGKNAKINAKRSLENKRSKSTIA